MLCRQRQCDLVELLLDYERERIIFAFVLETRHWKDIRYDVRAFFFPIIVNK